MGWGYKQLGTTQVAADDYSGAVESLQKSLAIKENSAAADPQNAQASLDLASGHADLAEALSALGDAAQAVEEAQKGITIMTALSAADPTNAIFSRNLAIDEEKLGDAFARSGANAQAPTAQRTHAWSDARVAYEKAGKIFADLRDLGTLPPADAGQPQKLTTLTANCQRAIEQLTAANPN